MRVVVFGAKGMLGAAVTKSAEEKNMQVVAAVRDSVNYDNAESIRMFVSNSGADYIVNCAGAIPSKTSSIYDMIRINSLFPQLLSIAVRETPIIHVSTDCVFSGRSSYKYMPTDIKDPKDYYGMSKSLGEPLAPNVLVLRTSFMGRDHGTMAWLCNQEPGATVEGWVNARWTGSTVEAVADAIIEVVASGAKIYGIQHLSTAQSISKYDAIEIMIRKLKLPINVKPTLHPYINKALKPTTELLGFSEALDRYGYTNSNPANGTQTGICQDNPGIDIAQPISA